MYPEAIVIIFTLKLGYLGGGGAVNERSKVLDHLRNARKGPETYTVADPEEDGQQQPT